MPGIVEVAIARKGIQRGDDVVEVDDAVGDARLQVGAEKRAGVEKISRETIEHA